MKSIVFIVAYYGTFPNYFPVWLNSCRQNPTIDFLVVTDNTPDKYLLPSNVRFLNMTFDKLRELIQRRFDFKISLDRPYKLCDYKPVYGEALQEWLAGYDFWGHCDIDLIWGNIRNFVTEEILERYDRICNQGHCSIYRNDPRVNSFYRILDPHSCLDWREVFTNDRNFSFDEYATINEDGSGGGLSRIMEINEERIYSKWIFANVTARQQKRFQISLDDHERECSPDQVRLFEKRYYSTESEAEMQLFERNSDGLYLWYCKEGCVTKKEFMYVHFSRRVVSVPSKITMFENYLFLPPARIELLSEPMTAEERMKQMKKNHAVIKRYSFMNDSSLIRTVLRGKRKIEKYIRK